jgi:hypothetical protein
VSASLDPVIVAARLDAGHDGLAEATVTVRYPNGAERGVILPCEVIDQALLRSGVTDLRQLVGQPWTVLATT